MDTNTKVVQRASKRRSECSFLPSIRQDDIGFSFTAYRATYRKHERERINRESRISAQPDWRDGVIAGMLEQALKREVRHA